MKLSATAARRIARNPDPEALGFLLHGPDPGLVALDRRDLVARLSDGDDLRVSRLDADTVRRSPAEIDAALRARGFFPGRRVVVVEGAKDGLAEVLEPALEGLDAADVALVVTATGITVKGALHKLFEKGRGLVAAGLYPDAGGDEDWPAALREAGCTARADDEALAALTDLAARLDAGAMRQTLVKLAAYAHGQDRLSAGDVAAVAPERPGSDAETDRLVAAVAGGDPAAVPGLVARLAAAGQAPGTMVGAVSRHLRHLLALALDPGGPRAGVERLRPPAFGARRERLLREADLWSGGRAERGLQLVHDLERDLRRAGVTVGDGGPERPERALAERVLLRLALIAAEGRGGQARGR